MQCHQERKGPGSKAEGQGPSSEVIAKELSKTALETSQKETKTTQSSTEISFYARVNKATYVQQTETKIFIHSIDFTVFIFK